MGYFRSPHGWDRAGVLRQKAPFPKICHKYPTMVKLALMNDLKKSQKNAMHITCPLSSADINILHWKSAAFVIPRNADIDCILTRNCHLF